MLALRRMIAAPGARMAAFSPQLVEEIRARQRWTLDRISPEFQTRNQVLGTKRTIGCVALARFTGASNLPGAVPQTCQIASVNSSAVSRFGW